VKSIIVLSAILFVASFVFTWLIKKISLKTNVLDMPNERSAHSVPTPSGGGLAIIIVWYIAVFILFSRKVISLPLFSALLCGIPIALIGMVDDIRKISPYLRLLIHALFASLAVYYLGRISNIDLGFIVLKKSLLLDVVAVMGVVWFINLFNFLDGIDGYLGAEIIFICIAAYILFGLNLPLVLAAATAGFLLMNWQPARIFLGDAGSTFLGFTIGIFTIYYQNTNQASLIIWLMLTSVFWVDATVTLFRRIFNKEKISVAHNKHAYQRIVQSGFSHQKTVLSAMVINCLIFILILMASRYPNLILPCFLINLAFLYYILNLIESRFPFKK
jgi:UDP-N-acetylmuramyl pentapeptide phosphotransferase/UDP-N-acetylglucosamine-1-phosphate transferase